MREMRAIKLPRDVSLVFLVLYIYRVVSATILKILRLSFLKNFWSSDTYQFRVYFIKYYTYNINDEI